LCHVEEGEGRLLGRGAVRAIAYRRPGASFSALRPDNVTTIHGVSGSSAALFGPTGRPRCYPRAVYREARTASQPSFAPAALRVRCCVGGSSRRHLAARLHALSEWKAGAEPRRWRRLSVYAHPDRALLRQPAARGPASRGPFSALGRFGISAFSNVLTGLQGGPCGDRPGTNEAVSIGPPSRTGASGSPTHPGSGLPRERCVHTRYNPYREAHHDGRAPLVVRGGRGPCVEARRREVRTLTCRRSARRLASGGHYEDLHGSRDRTGVYGTTRTPRPACAARSRWCAASQGPRVCWRPRNRHSDYPIHTTPTTST